MKYYETYQVAGAPVGEVRNLILFTVMEHRIHVEFYSPDLKCESVQLEAVISKVNESNSSSHLKIAVCLTKCSVRVSADIWLDNAWPESAMHGAIMTSVRGFISHFRNHVTEFLPYCRRTPTSLQKQPEVLSPYQHITQCLLTFLESKRINDFREKIERHHDGWSIEFSQPDYTQSTVQAKFVCNVQVTQAFVQLSFTSDQLLSLIQTTHAMTFNYLCKISASLSIARILFNPTTFKGGRDMHTWTSQARCISVESKLRYDMLNNESFKFPYFYAAVLEEYNKIHSELRKLRVVDFPGGIEFLAIHKPYEAVLDYSDDTPSGDWEETSFTKHYTNSTKQKELNIIKRLKEADLLDNFGLVDSIDSDDSFSSVTFRPPTCKSLDNIGESIPDSELPAILKHLHRMITTLLANQLAFIDLSAQELYWDNSTRESIGLHVYCATYLYDILEVTSDDVTRQENPSQQIQKLLMRKLRNRRMAQLAVEDEVDEVTVYRQSSQRTYVSSIDGVSRAAIYCEDISRLGADDVQCLRESLYRAYQLYQHPAIITCYGVRLQADHQAICFAYEDCPTNLQRLVSQGVRLPYPITFLRSLASALGFMSSKPPIKVSITPKRVLVSSSCMPKLKPFYYKESKDFRYLTPYEAFSPDWSKSLMYSFGLVMLYVFSGRDVEYDFCQDGISTAEGFIGSLRQSSGPLIGYCGPAVHDLLVRCFKGRFRSFNQIIAKLDEMKPSME
jgi:hypothetical protein